MTDPATSHKDNGFDLAIHSGDLPDSNLVARKFAQTMIILVATPQYVMRHGMPESPEDLPPLSSGCFCRAWVRPAVEYRVRTKRKAHYPYRGL